MFSPDAFLNLALVLGKGSSATEAHWRTGVGRAYYAAYLACREWGRTGGMTVTKMGVDHKETRKWLKDKGKIAAGHKLEKLASLRGTADYDLDKQITSPNCVTAITLATDIIAKL